MSNTQVYEPTQKEQALLEILLNPENRMKSVTDICKLAQCSRNVYYEAFAKPGFRALYEEKTKDLVKQAIGPIINTFIREAKRGNFQHVKVLLEMAGLYNERSSIEVTGDVSILEMSREERRAKLMELLSKNEFSENGEK